MNFSCFQNAFCLLVALLFLLPHSSPRGTKRKFNLGGFFALRRAGRSKRLPEGKKEKQHNKRKNPMFDDEERKANKVTCWGHNVDNTNIALYLMFVKLQRNEQRILEETFLLLSLFASCYSSLIFVIETRAITNDF